MKKIMLMMLVLVAASVTVQAQKKWEDLTKEEKMMKVQAFRDDNQKYLKDSLGMTADQMVDIDNVNLCYLGTIERIGRYGKNEDNMNKFAKAVTEARAIQLEAIMGADKRKLYMNYVQAKLKKAGMIE